jgi:hypothetical protein
VGPWVQVAIWDLVDLWGQMDQEAA